MSLDELRADLASNLAEAKRITSVQEMRDHLVNTLWPFIEAKLDVIDEIDDAVAELVDQQEDYLQPETAAVFAAVVQSSLQLVGELKQWAPRDNADIAQKISAHEQLCAQAVTVLGEVTMVAAEDDEDEDGNNEEGGSE